MSGSGTLVGTGASGIAGLMASMACPGHREPEFATINGPSLLLVPDSMPGVSFLPVEVKTGGYYTLAHLRQDNATTENEAATNTGSATVSTFGAHTHNFVHNHLTPNIGLQDGDRVFIVWATNTPVVTGKI